MAGDGPGPAWKLTTRRKERIINAVKAGNYAYVAAQHAGISKGTLFKYIAMGRQHLERALADGVLDPDMVEEAQSVAELSEQKSNPVGEVLRAAGWPEHQVLMVELVDELARAEAEAELRLVTILSAAAPTDWRAAVALLARRHPERWMERSATELTGAAGGPIEVYDARLRNAMTADPQVMLAARQVALAMESTVGVNEPPPGAWPGIDAGGDDEHEDEHDDEP